jgi:WD40 repeat protein
VDRRGHEGPVNAVAISPDNRWVVTGSDDETARLWLLQMKDLNEPRSHRGWWKFFR